MRRTPITSLALALAGALALEAGAAGALRAESQDPQYVTAQQEPHFSADQLDNLVAPVALYADPLLAQVLLAATFPDQIAEAAQYVRGNGTDGIDEQGWDVSVKAVAHYPTVLNLMDSRMEWTTTLGQAYAAQSTDVMHAVQRMRRMAQAQGNLTSSPEQEVLYDNDYIRIWPAQARVIYVPVYDPAVVYVRPVFRRPGFHAYFSFGVPFAIGPWLIYDWDWPRWRIYYTGWYGGGWIARSRPYIRVTNVYFNPDHRRVWYDREVLRRRPDYGRVHYYDAIHPGVRFDGLHRARRAESALGTPAAPPTRQALPRDGGASRTAQPRYGTPRPVPTDTRPADQTPRVIPDRSPTADRPTRTEPVQSGTGDRTWRRAPVQSAPGAEPMPRVIPMDRTPSVERPAPTERAAEPRVITIDRGGRVERVERAPDPRVIPMDRGDRSDRGDRVERAPEPRVVPMDRGSDRVQRAEPQSRPAPEARPRGGDAGPRGGDSGRRAGGSGSRGGSSSSSGGMTTRRGH